jgi:hypothetical protein
LRFALHFPFLSHVIVRAKEAAFNVTEKKNVFCYKVNMRYAAAGAALVFIRDPTPETDNARAGRKRARTSEDSTPENLDLPPGKCQFHLPPGKCQFCAGTGTEDRSAQSRALHHTVAELDSEGGH